MYFLNGLKKCGMCVGNQRIERVKKDQKKTGTDKSKPVRYKVSSG